MSNILVDAFLWGGGGAGGTAGGWNFGAAGGAGGAADDYLQVTALGGAGPGPPRGQARQPVTRQHVQRQPLAERGAQHYLTSRAGSAEHEAQRTPPARCGQERSVARDLSSAPRRTVTAPRT